MRQRERERERERGRYHESSSQQARPGYAGPTEIRFTKPQSQPQTDPTPNTLYDATGTLDEDPHIKPAKVAKIGFMDKKFHRCLTLSRLNRGS